MTARAACCCAVVLLAATACGSAHGAGATVRQPMAAVDAPRTRPVSISGGTARQRALLRTIVAAERPTAIRALRIVPPSPAWQPLRPGDVELQAIPVPADSPTHENLLGEWESWVIGGAFRDRSAAAGLPRVVVVGDGEGASRVWPSNTHLPAGSPAGLAAFRRRVEATLRRFPVRVVYVRIGAPDGFTAAVGLQTPHAASFIEHRLNAVDQALFRIRTDGWFVALYDRRGNLADAGGNGARMSIGGGGAAAPRYRGCVERGDLGFDVLPLPYDFAPPLFCPTDWRPPASRPPRPLRLTRTVAAGTQAGYGADGTAHIPFRPGLRFGAGFGLQNLNGAPVRVESITLGGSAAAIRFTGVRIQVPASRLHAGRAGELRPPYRPLPRLRPFTVRPGDWVGVAMHFLIAPCSPAISGRTLVADRTVTISWLLRGRTMRHTYRSLPLRIHVPAC